MNNKELLLQKLNEHINSVEGINKKKYVTIASSIKDDDFIATLPTILLQQLNEITNHFQNDGNLDFNWIESSQANLKDSLSEVYFKGLAFNNDKKKNVNHFEVKTQELEKNIEAAQQDIARINETAKLISGASILSEYSKDFDEQAKKHEINASTWLKYLIYSILGLCLLIVFILFFNISDLPVLKKVLSEDILNNKYFSILIIAIKTGLIVAYLQIPSFLKRNYYAEKHLNQACNHRRDVLKALHAVYNTIDNKEEKDRLITVGASIAFTEPESGYITRKEGAGDGSEIASSILALITKAPK